jgi:hypothetical protein
MRKQAIEDWVSARLLAIHNTRECAGHPINKNPRHHACQPSPQRCSVASQATWRGGCFAAAANHGRLGAAGKLLLPAHSLRRWRIVGV